MTGLTSSDDGGGPSQALATAYDGHHNSFPSLLQLLLENTSDIVVHTIEGVLQWVSPSIEDVTGWTPDELTGSTTAHLWHPDDREIAISQREATYAGEPSRGTLRLRRKDGDYVWLDVALKPYIGPDGRVGAVGSMRDVSALVLARSRAEHQRLQLQQLFDSMLEPHLLLTPVRGAADEVVDFTVTAANKVAAHVLDTPRESLVGARLSTLVSPQASTEMTARMAGWLHAENAVTIDDWHSLSSTGEDRYFDVMASPVGADLLIAWRDVTERHVNAAMLEASEAAYRLLAENAADVIVRLNAGDEVTWASPSCHRLLGYLPEELLGRIRSELIHPEDQATFSSALATLRGGTSGVATRELRLHHRHGGYSWWSLAARRTNDHPAESDIVLALSSIDAEKRAELTIHEEQARRAAALESMFDPHVLLRAMTDINGKIVDFQYIDANAAACDYMDMSPEQLVGRTVLELLPAHDQTRLLQRYIDTLNTGHPLVLNDYEYPHEVLATRRLFDIRAVKVGDCLSFTWRDVTERNDAAQLLRDSEQRYRLLAEHIGDAVVSADPTGVIDFVSPSVELMLGWLPEELTGQRVVALVHPDDIEQAAAASVALRAGQPTASGRVRLRHKDGGWKWMASVTRAVHNEAGEIASTISTWRDIQAEVEAEERLTASERRFRLLAEHSLDIVATLTLDGRIEWISPSAEQVLGWSPAETVGRRYLDLIDPQDRRWFDEEVRRLAAMSEPSRLTVRVLRANADSLWMEAVGQQSTDPATGESMRVVRLRDVQDAHVAHEVLQRQRARLSETVNGVADPLMLLDPVFDDSRVVDFLVEEVNNAACRYLRLDRAELVGAHLLDQVPGLKAAGLFDKYVQALSTDEPLTVDDVRVYSESEGADRWFDNRATSSHGRLVVTWRDVTDRHLVRQALEDALARTRLLAENATDVVFRTDAAGVLEFCSEGVERLLGFTPEDLIGSAFLDMVHPDDRGGFEGLLKHVGRIPSVRARLRTKHEAFVWVEFNTRGMVDRSGNYAGLVGGWRDVSAEVAIQHRLQDQARLDDLTGLINRGEVFRRLEAILSHPPRTGTQVAVAFVDLDNLKDINDTWGHAAGDALIRATANRLRSAVRSDDIVARIGGDELLVVLPGVHSLDEAVSVVDTLRKIVSRPLEEGIAVRSTASFGVTLARPGDTSDKVIARADRAMYEAKITGDRVVGMP